MSDPRAVPSPARSNAVPSPPPPPEFDFSVLFDWKDFLSGTAAGVAICLTGHPFDTAKVRLQTQDVLKLMGIKETATRFEGGIHALAHTVKSEGFLALYKGMGGPLLTVPLLNAIVFAAYEQGKRLMGQSDSSKLTLTQIGIAGGWAGFVNVVVATPVELVKSRLQIQFEVNQSQSVHRGPMAAIRSIIVNEGVRGLFRGTVATIFREIPAYGAQFYFYEASKRFFIDRHRAAAAATASSSSSSNCTSASPPSLSVLEQLISGGVGGVMCWVWSYPQDIIKSRLQIQQSGVPSIYRTMLFDGGFFHCLGKTVRYEGISALFKGFSACTYRAFVANATGLFTYEFVMKELKRRYPES